MGHGGKTETAHSSKQAASERAGCLLCASLARMLTLMPPLLRRFLAAALLIPLLFSASPATAQSPAAAADIKGKRVFTCAHSFHVFVYRMLEEIAKSAGI